MRTSMTVKVKNLGSWWTAALLSVSGLVAAGQAVVSGNGLDTHGRSPFKNTSIATVLIGDTRQAARRGRAQRAASLRESYYVYRLAGTRLDLIAGAAGRPASNFARSPGGDDACRSASSLAKYTSISGNLHFALTGQRVWRRWETLQIVQVSR